MAWVDYKKAYGMIPHSWILKCLEMFGAAGNIIALLEKSMNNWETELTASGRTLGTVNVERYLSGGQPVSIAVHCGPNSTNNGVAASESWL